MSRPLVSVIVPSFNSSRYIGAALDSVFAQEFKDYEIIVVDDVSTDGTLEILKTYGDRIEVVERNVNSRSADIPRYDGVERARGKYCAFLDSDDLWAPDKLSKQVRFMDENRSIPLSHTYVWVIDERGERQYMRHEGGIPQTGECGAALLKHCFISTSSVMVKRDEWLRAQRREELAGFGTEWDFFLGIARTLPIGFIPEPLASYRIVSTSVSRRTWKRTPRDVGAKERILRKGLWRGIVNRSGMKQTIAEASLENSQFWRDRKRPERAIWFAMKAIKHRPFWMAAWSEMLKSSGRAMMPSFELNKHE